MATSGGMFLHLLTTASQYSAADFQRSALEMLRGVCDFDMAMWGVVSFKPNARTIYQSISMHDVPVEVFREFGSVAEHDGVAHHVLSHPDQDVAGFNLRQRLPDQRHADFLAYTRRFEFNNLMYVTLPHAQSDALNFIGLWRRRSQSEYTANEVGRSRELLRGAVLAGTINDNLSFKSPLTIRNNSGFLRARVSTSGVVLAFDAGFNDLIQRQWPKYLSPLLPAELVRALRDSRHHKFLGKHLIASAATVGDSLFVVATANRRHIELTPKQFDVACLVARGCSNKEVAYRLGISEKTIANHLSAIYLNLGLHERSNADPASDNHDNWRRAALIRWWLEHPCSDDEPA